VGFQCVIAASRCRKFDLEALDFHDQVVNQYQIAVRSKATHLIASIVRGAEGKDYGALLRSDAVASVDPDR